MTPLRSELEEIVRNHEPSWESREGLPHLKNDEDTISSLELLIEKREKAAAAKEWQDWLDDLEKWRNRKPVPGELTTASFGSASGAMEVSGMESRAKSRIAELRGDTPDG